MGVAVEFEPADSGGPQHEKRNAPRFTSLIRAAKLVSAQGEFVCVLRDVSSTGVRLKCFHRQPTDDVVGLELQNGEMFEIRKVREDGFEASYTFLTPVPVETLIHANSVFPRRQLRIAMAIPVKLRTLTGVIPAITVNLSQQGARLEPEGQLALAQSVTLEGPHLPAIRAKVRWRREGSCGLVFEDTFTLADFAVRTARLQCPLLVTAGALGN
ncbi:PilZ domain-containing protein [Qipengyuania sp.]|uniref:PilZ domain-containing protein n=1 Tax=Qipengyuania sp. TaxID=2004515 RepID=UPI0035C80474